MASPYVAVFVTTGSREEAEKIVNCLLEERLVACVNIIGPVLSRFWWAEKIEKTEEYVLLMKSRLDLFDKLSERVMSLHSFEVPEIIVLPIVKGSEAYMKWLSNCLR